MTWQVGMAGLAGQRAYWAEAAGLAGQAGCIQRTERRTMKKVTMIGIGYVGLGDRRLSGPGWATG